MSQDSLSALEKKLNVSFRDKSLLRLALTHSSHNTAQHGSYERLEFLGDRVLGLLIADFIYREYPQDDEGQLSRRFVDLVRNETLMQIAQDMELMPHIRLARGQDSTRARIKTNAMADVCEAILAAVYIDQGLDAARELLLRFWAPYLEALRKPPRDPKTALQEWAQGRKLSLPHYETISRSGPDHNPLFVMAVHVEGFKPRTGQGNSKRQAEQQAAFALLQEEVPEITNVVITA